MKKNGRIYICHTYYHVYVTFLKELRKPAEEKGRATLMLSTMSNHFESLKERVESTGMFREVLMFEEKREDFFPELAQYRKDKGNIFFNMLSRIRFTKEYARLEAPFIPMDLRQYEDIYVYCDSDPIGYYLNQNKIPYHAMEDGLNCLKNFDAARFDNRGMFGLKAFMSNRLNLIFVQNGYGKYCIDMEVNDISAIAHPCPKYIEVSRQALTDKLTPEDKEILIKAFVRDEARLKEQIKEANEKGDKILILTDPLCSLEVRKRIFEDIIEQYRKEGTIFIKPHPRDALDYRTLFSEYPQFDATLPMEILNFFPNLHFKKVVAVLTEIKAIQFADETVRLGPDFMDKYEDPLIHRQNEQIYEPVFSQKEQTEGRSKKTKMIKIFKKLNILLDKKQKVTMFFLVIMMVIGAGLQVAGVGMIVPVVSIVMDQNAIENNALVSSLYHALGGGDSMRFSVIVMCSLIGIFVVKNVFLYFQLKCTYAFVYKNQFRTSERMMKNYLRRNYEFYLNADTSVVQRSITSDVNNMYALILALLQLLSDGIIFVFLVIYCLAQDAAMTFLIAGVLLVLLYVIKKILKPVMHKAGEDNQNYYSGLFKWILQTVQGIKEVKIAGKEQYFVSEYVKCGQGYVDAVQKYSLYNNIPKLVIETVCVMCMIGYILFMMLKGVPSGDMMQTLTTFAAAALVLLPCVNRINNQINSMAYFEPFFMGVSDNLQDEIASEKTDMSFADEASEKLPVKDAITLSHITYAYPNTEKYIFKDAFMKIPIGAAVGIVGTSGAGKTTVVDILLGLLQPSEGHVYADKTDIQDAYRAWLKNIGYIPQMIFMLDDTIRRNVAFGVAEDKIDEERVWEVLKEAQLDDFVRSLPEGLDTGIGERGIRLSGGQRQRIGIARALYEDPEILILDEATSALDNDTEAAIMDAINRLHGKKTLVIIAHRLQTIANCEIVYRVENGGIVQEKGEKINEA